MPRLSIELVGTPRIIGGPAGQSPARKSWGLLTWLLLGSHCGRRQAAELLFAEADDPLAALRWALSDLRRAAGAGVVGGGDPIHLDLDQVSVDVHRLQQAHWSDAVALPSLGQELLDGARFVAAPRFELWLDSERRRLAGVTVAVLHEAALACLARGSHDSAVAHARRVTELSPLEENGHALLVRCLASAGLQAEADDHVRLASALLAAELGVPASDQLERAARQAPRVTDALSVPAIRAHLEAGQAAIAAGVLTEGLAGVQQAVDAARRPDARSLLIEGLVALGSALVHAARGSDEEGAAALHEAGALAEQEGDHAQLARVYRELGYLGFLRAHYPRAFHWLDRASRETDDPAERAWADVFAGACHGDCGDHAAAATRLDSALGWAESVGDLRMMAYARSFLGRTHLLLGDLPRARADLDRSLDEARRAAMTSVLPWPMALRAEVARLDGDVAGSAELAEQAFVLGCQLGDPCWEGLAARGLGMAASERGDVDSALAHLEDAARRAGRLPDTYVWARVWIAQARCEVAVRHGLDRDGVLLQRLEADAARYGMRDIIDRATQLRQRASAAGTIRTSG